MLGSNHVLECHNLRALTDASVNSVIPSQCPFPLLVQGEVRVKAATTYDVVLPPYHCDDDQPAQLRIFILADRYRLAFQLDLPFASELS